MLPESHPFREAQQFLLTLFKEAPQDQWIEFRAIKSEKNTNPKAPRAAVECCAVADLEKSFDLVIADWIQRHQKVKFDIYFGVCPRFGMRRDRDNRLLAGNAANVQSATAAWVDLDKDTWREIVKAADINPSIVVASGNGAHLYFLYGKTVEIAKAVADSKMLTKKFGGDKTFDAPRILRVPGTKNWKGEGSDCRLVHSKPEQVFEGIKDEDAGMSTTLKDVGYELRTVVFNGHKFARYPYAPEEYQGGDDVDRSQIDYRVMKSLFVHGMDEDAIREIFTDPQYKIGDKVRDEAARGNGENYLMVTIRKARSDSEVERARNMEIGECLNLMTTADLAKAPRLAFAVERILPVGGSCFITGPAKSGKSFLVTDLVLLMAGAEGAFLDRFCALEPGPVLYCQKEIMPSELKERLNVIAAGRGIMWERLPLHFFCDRFDLGNQRHTRALTNGLRKARAKYLVIDPLARYHTKNENKVDHMTEIFRNIEWVAKEAGLLGWIVVHHHGKPTKESPREGAFMARGSSVIADWGNSHVFVQKIFSDATERKFIKTGFELRSAKEPAPLSLMLDESLLRFVDYSEEEERLQYILTRVKDLDENDPVPDDVIADISHDLKAKPKEVRRLITKERARRKFGHGTQESGQVGGDE